MCCLIHVCQGDLFSEAPKLPVSDDKNLLNESLRSTAHAAGSAHIYRQDTDNCSEKLEQKTKLQPEDGCFCTARVINVDDHFIFHF